MNAIFMKKSLFFVVCILILCTFCFSQDTRVEIKLNRIPNEMEVISLEKKGFLLLYSGGERRGNNNSLNVTRFNTNFEEQWNKLVDIPSRFTIETYLIDSNSNRFIWISKSSSHLRLDILDLKDGLNSTQTYSLGKHAKDIVSSKIAGNDLFILFKHGPDERAGNCFSMCCFPVALPLRMAGMSIFRYGSIYNRIDIKNQLKYEHSDAKRGITIPDKIQSKTNSNETISVSAFMQKPHSRGKSVLVVKNIDINLKTRDSIIINAPKDLFLQNIQLVESENGFAGAGTFDNSPPDPDANIYTVNTQGFYTVIIDSANNVNSLKLFRFSELKSFDQYIEDINIRGHSELSENRKKRIKKRYRNYSTMLKFNEIVERENDFIATGEAFYPVYSSYRDANGNMVQYFEGYNYTHCLIICFDKMGNIKWDRTVPLNFNRLYLNISQKVEVLQNGENVQLSYGSGGNINVITIDKDTINDPQNFKLPRLFKDDEKASEYIADVTPWYGNKYLIWGVQKIKKSEIKERQGSNLIYMDEMEVK